MRVNNRHLVARVTAFALFAGSAFAQESSGLNARDAFYSAADLLGTKKPVAAAPSQNSGRSLKPVAANRPAKPVPASAKQNPEAYFQNAAAVPSAIPLGLRYSILKEGANGMQEAPTQSVFHSGDRIRLDVMGNQKGHLYVISRGSSGIWTPLYPPPGGTTQNEIVPGRQYVIPSGPDEYFTFDSKAGEEKLFVLFAKAGDQDLDAMIQNLSERVPSRTPDERAVDNKPPDPRQRSVDHLNDQTIAGLRTNGVQARDLVFTRTDDAQTSSNKPDESAVYVVNANPDKQSNSRVVVELSLSHQ